MCMKNQLTKCYNNVLHTVTVLTSNNIRTRYYSQVFVFLECIAYFDYEFLLLWYKSMVVIEEIF